MASNAKRKTTMAKLNREAKMRDKKIAKQARKDRRKADAAMGIKPEGAIVSMEMEPLESDQELEPVAPDQKR
jgi:uncharacterized membrane protein